MSETETVNQPDPTFLKDDVIDLKKPLGLAIEKRQQDLDDKPVKPRLSRREFETLLDSYYAIGDGEGGGSGNDRPAVLPASKNHAGVAGRRMVRNLALTSVMALLLGFGIGLYGLSRQGGETRLGQEFNQSLAQLWKMVLPAAAGKQSRSDRQAAPGMSKAVGPAAKPIKTASIVVADASGTLLAGIPLKLTLGPDADASLLQVKIMNVPGDAVLTAGTRRNDGVWILQPSDLKNVSLVVSSDRKLPLRLDIELIEARTGELMSPTRQIKVAIIQPEPFRVGGL